MPTAGGGEVEGAVGGEDPGGGDDVDVGVPEEKVAEGLDGDDEAGLAVGLAGAQAEPGGEGGVRGEIEMAEASAVVAEERAEEAGRTDGGGRGADRGRGQSPGGRTVGGARRAMADEGRDRRAEGSTPSYFVKMDGLFFSRDGGIDPLISGLIVVKKWRQAFSGSSGWSGLAGAKAMGGVRVGKCPQSSQGRSEEWGAPHRSRFLGQIIGRLWCGLISAWVR